MTQLWVRAEFQCGRCRGTAEVTTQVELDQVYEQHLLTAGCGPHEPNPLLRQPNTITYDFSKED